MMVVFNLKVVRFFDMFVSNRSYKYSNRSLATRSLGNAQLYSGSIPRSVRHYTYMGEEIALVRDWALPGRGTKNAFESAS